MAPRAAPKSRLLNAVALTLLVVQNVSLVLTVKTSLLNNKDQKPYLVTVAVMVSEVLKLAICAVVLGVQGKSFDWGSLLRLEGLKVSVPALLYVLQNNLLFFAVSRLEPAVYQVTYQLKIFTTAIFSVVLLGRRLTWSQIVGIVLLLPGVALVQVSRMSSAAKAPPSAASHGVVGKGMEAAHHGTGTLHLHDDPLHHDESASIGASSTAIAPAPDLVAMVAGLIAVLSSAVSSGFAGVYFERVLKSGKKVGLWERNVQLASYSIVISFLSMVAKDMDKVACDGMFQGFRLSTGIVVILQAGGGLLIAVVVKYADNITKAFATSVAVIISSLLSIFLFGFDPPLLFYIGAALVGIAVYFYSVKNVACVESACSKVVKSKPAMELPLRSN